MAAKIMAGSDYLNGAAWRRSAAWRQQWRQAAKIIISIRRNIFGKQNVINAGGVWRQRQHNAAAACGGAGAGIMKISAAGSEKRRKKKSKQWRRQNENVERNKWWLKMKVMAK